MMRGSNPSGLMTVGDIVDELKRFPPDMDFGYRKPNNPDGIYGITLQNFQIKKNGDSYYMELVLPGITGEKK